MINEPIEVVIDGAPPTNVRPGRWRRKCNDVRAWVERQMDERAPLTGALACEIVAVFAVPRKWPAWKRELGLGGQVMHTVSPRAAELITAAENACAGLVWSEQAQLSLMTVRKLYGRVPRISVAVWPIDRPCTQTASEIEAVIQTCARLVVRDDRPSERRAVA